MAKRWLVGWLLSLALLGSAAAAPGIFRTEVQAPIDKVYPAVHAALEAAHFWVVFEADMLASISRFAEEWGAEFNKSKLDAMRSMVVCNGWFTNTASGADPDLLALCPLHVSFYERAGTTVVLFARPTVLAQDSPGAAVAADIEKVVIQAINDGVAQAQ